MIQSLAKLTLIISILLNGYAQAQVLFEGYSKVTSAGQHVGYVVNRYEFDQKKKQFVSISFLKTNEVGGNLAESLVARAKEDFSPVSYQYTTIVGKNTRSIDAKFEKGRLKATIKDGEKLETIDREIPKGTFLSTFLAYVMAKNQKGITTDAKYDYQAIAEEDAALHKGIAVIREREDFMGMKAFKVLNEFKGTKFISYMNDKAEVLGTKSPVFGIGTELSAQPSLATSGHNVPASILKQLFGDVPTGQINEVSRARNQQPTTTTTPVSKQQGVPAGQNIQVKPNQPTDKLPSKGEKEN